MKNQVQLITYVDRLSGGGISALNSLLRNELQGVFGGVHILPFFHPIDGADAGFDPIDHTQVDHRLGTWADIRTLTRDVDIVADVIVNHVSIESPPFRDYLQRGSASEYHGMFLTRASVFPKGASDADVRAIYRPRPTSPFTRVTLQTGEEEVLWTTFTPQQVDIDVQHPQAVAYLDRILRTFSENGIGIIRLDAVGYAIKKPGSSCFMLPETFEFIAAFSQRARQLGIEVLVEVHSHYRQQIEIAAQVDWVYDFALPPLILHAFEFRTAKYLQEWIRIRPVNALIVLDTHDGIGIVDVGADHSDAVSKPGLVPAEELDRLVESIHRNSRGESRLATGNAASNLDLYQVNCTFYDALARDDLRYLLARAIQFFLPGIPQVYYVGLLAGRNDMALLKQTGNGRDINRHYYERGEVAEALRRHVVQDLVRLIRLRNSHPAFNGQFRLLPTDEDSVRLRWDNDVEFAELVVHFDNGDYSLRHSHDDRIADLVFDSRCSATGASQ